MVTHTRNVCSAFSQPKCTHTPCTHTPWTHTSWTHTRSSGQPFMQQRLGRSWGFGALHKSTSVVVLKVESYIHSPPTYNPCRPETRTHNLSITSPTLTIRPRLPKNSNAVKYYNVTELFTILKYNLFLWRNKSKLNSSSYYSSVPWSFRHHMLIWCSGNIINVSNSYSV